ncbi:MAG: Zn-ribbon domain-containing OB-fold protein [Acidimicrobiia bacterium]|nr:Zn-ribbon domain-containing OB-fold protein [Acidimicrobiia bacterium]
MRFDLPAPEPETRPVWDAAREERLLVKRCADCGEAHFYPRPFCPRCWSEDVTWEEASGDATLYTWSTVHVNDLPPFPERVPYVAAIVELAEGPRMMTNVVDCDDAQLEVGMALHVRYRELDDEFSIPVFAPA